MHACKRWHRWRRFQHPVRLSAHGRQRLLELPGSPRPEACIPALLDPEAPALENTWQDTTLGAAAASPPPVQPPAQTGAAGNWRPCLLRAQLHNMQPPATRRPCPPCPALPALQPPSPTRWPAAWSACAWPTALAACSGVPACSDCGGIAHGSSDVCCPAPAASWRSWTGATWGLCSWRQTAGPQVQRQRSSAGMQVAAAAGMRCRTRLERGPADKCC